MPFTTEQTYKMRDATTPLEGDDGAIRGFLRHRHDLSPQTQAWYGGLLGRFAAWLRTSGVQPIVASVNIDTAEQYLDARREVVRASSTRCDAVVLKSFANYLGQRVLKTDSPLKDLRIPKMDDTTRRPLANEELSRLLSVSRRGENGKRNHAIVSAAAGCGLRLGELVALRYGDVDFDNAALVVRGPTSKSKKTRRVTMHDEVASAIDAYRGEEREGPEHDDAALFLARGHKPFKVQGLSAVFRMLAEESEIPDLTAHTLRHTWATNFLRAGSGDIIDLSRDAGWNDKQNRMAWRYSHEKPIAERRRQPSPFSVLTMPPNVIVYRPKARGNRAKRAPVLGTHKRTAVS